MWYPGPGGVVIMNETRRTVPKERNLALFVAFVVTIVTLASIFAMRVADDPTALYPPAIRTAELVLP